MIVYLVDTLRADHLGVYGYGRGVSPHLDAFAADAVIFENAVAQSSWTKPAVASIFTGLWPGTHRVHETGQVLPDRAETLAEMLRARGFQTAGFVANGHVTERYGFDQGFDDFAFLRPAGERGPLPSAAEVNGAALAWIEAREWRRPFFLYVHTVDPHSPYEPPPELRRRFAAAVKEEGLGSRRSLKALRLRKRPAKAEVIDDLISLYDAEIAYADRSFGALVQRLRQLGLYDDALIVFLADHGEEFHERGGWEHGGTLHAEVLDVPLIIKFPRAEHWGGVRVAALAQQVDLLPTILDYIGVPVPDHLEGRSLLGLVASSGGTGLDGATAFAHLDKGKRRQECVVEEPWKLLRVHSRRGGSRLELYDRRADPGERTNVIERHPVIAGYLSAELRWRELRSAAVLEPRVALPDADVRENLRALGYVE